MRNQWRLVVGGWGLCLILIACQPVLTEGADEKTVTATIDVKRIETIIPQRTLEKTALPSSALSFTTTPTMNLTQGTPLSQQKNKLTEWMYNFDLCPLPCWLGVIPGKTKFEDVIIEAQNQEIWDGYDNEPEHKLVTFKQGFRTSVQIMRDGDVNRLDWIDSLYLADEEMVDRIEAQVDLLVEDPIDPITDDFYLSSYSMENVVQQYGVPDAVLLDGLGDSPAPKLGYWFTLVYYQEGFSITYSGVTPKAKTVLICPALSMNQVLSFGIISQKQNAFYPLEVIPFLGKFQWHTLEEASGVDLNTFYEQVLDQGNKTCFVVPLSAFSHDK